MAALLMEAVGEMPLDSPAPGDWWCFLAVTASLQYLPEWALPAPLALNLPLPLFCEDICGCL